MGFREGLCPSMPRFPHPDARKSDELVLRRASSEQGAEEVWKVKGVETGSGLEMSNPGMCKADHGDPVMTQNVHEGRAGSKLYLPPSRGGSAGRTCDLIFIVIGSVQ